MFYEQTSGYGYSNDVIVQVAKAEQTRLLNEKSDYLVNPSIKLRPAASRNFPNSSNSSTPSSLTSSRKDNSKQIIVEKNTEGMLLINNNVN